jgi:1-deoxy-D-xylulose-5-phosphate reductoisomerase
MHWEYCCSFTGKKRTDEIMAKRLAIIGSTGSIGTQALDVIRTYPEELEAAALAAGRNAAKLEEQIREFHPELVCMWDEEAAADLRVRVADQPVKVVSGMEGLCEIAMMEHSDMFLNAVVGMIGIQPTLAAIGAGKTIALANKETLVTAGHLIMPAAAAMGVDLLPVDSEHSAIFQCMNGEPRSRIEKILLTCSGGTFRGKKRADLLHKHASEALNNPNWDMGAKVTIDSASLVNKGLEVMEAKWLFDVDVDQIQVVVQPQSIMHSAVQYVDGSVLAHLASPDMRQPIQYAFFYPDRMPLSIKPLDLFELADLRFERPDTETFRGLPLAYRAAHAGGSMPTVFNAANEEAVSHFMKDEIEFLDIYDLIEEAMDEHDVIAVPTLEQILETEEEARENVRRRISMLRG